MPLLKVLNEDPQLGSQELVKLHKSHSIEKVYCSEANTYLLTDAGEVLATGCGKYGQLGTNKHDAAGEDVGASNQIQDFRLIPVFSVTHNNQIKALACGNFHTLAVREGGGVLAWGWNRYGQLGRNDSREFFVDPGFVENFKTCHVLCAAAGATHSLVVVQEESYTQVYSFGSAKYGQLGQGNLSAVTNIYEPGKITALKKENVMKVACGAHHSMAVDSEQQLYLWGQGSSGQLGFGHKENVYEPVKSGLKGDCQDVSGGTSHTLALVSGKLYIWGEHLTESGVPALQKTPVKVKFDEEIVQILAGNNCSIVVMTSKTDVYYWGNSIKSCLPGCKENSASMTRHSVKKKGKIKAMDLGIYHGAFVTSEGKLFVWGYAKNGRTAAPQDSVSDRLCVVEETQVVSLERLLHRSSGQRDYELHEGANAYQDLLMRDCESTDERTTREVDKQLLDQLEHFKMKFEELKDYDSQLTGIHAKMSFKMLNRLEEPPFCIHRALMKQRNIEKPQIKDEDFALRNVYFGAILSTFQLHICYFVKLLDLNLFSSDRLFDMVLSNMEYDDVLIYTAYYLSKLLLRTTDGAGVCDFLLEDNYHIYRNLVLRIIKANQDDMKRLRAIATGVIRKIIEKLTNDFKGIDPLDHNKNSGKTSKQIYWETPEKIDRDIKNVRNTLREIIELLRSVPDSSQPPEIGGFSEILSLIVRDIIGNIGQKIGQNIEKLNEEDQNNIERINLIFSLIFDPLLDMVQNPWSYMIPTENPVDQISEQLCLVSTLLKHYFTNKKFGKEGDYWLEKLNNEILYSKDAKEDNPKKDNLSLIQIKGNILRFICDKEIRIENQLFKLIYQKSLKGKDPILTIRIKELYDLTDAIHTHLPELVLRDLVYDPLAYLMNRYSEIPKHNYKTNPYVNIPLRTRVLRDSQQLKKCPCCDMVIPQEYDNGTSEKLIELYEPEPEGTSADLYTKILQYGPLKTEKRISDYIDKFIETQTTLNNYKMIEYGITLKEKIIMQAKITRTNDPQGLSSDSGDSVLQQDIEKRYIELDKKCIANYQRRKLHIEFQQQKGQILAEIEEEFQFFENSRFCNYDAVIYNLGFGAANRHLSEYSDPIIYKLKLQDIIEDATKRTISLTLYESLNSRDIGNLTGFSVRKLKALTKKGVILKHNIFSCIELKSNQKISINFDLRESELHMTVYISYHKLKIFRRDDFRKETVLFIKAISIEDINEIRSNAFKRIEFLYDLQEQGFEITFNSLKFIDLIRNIDSSVSTYMKNFTISKETDKKNQK